MIQINLIPSIKAEYVKAQRTKRMVVTISVIAIAVAVGVVGLLAAYAYGAQSLQLNNAQDVTKKLEKQIKDVDDLDKILTIQNQLTALTPLHESKPVMTRLFTYLQQTTPKDVTLSKYAVSNTESTWSVEGKAPSIEAVNKYVDTIKFTEIEGQNGARAFSDVVLTSFAKDGAAGGYTFAVNYKFNSELFASANPNIKLFVPPIVTTRSQTELPSGSIFAPANNQEAQ